ncbi:MAG: hypothetical protein V8T86_18630 [Victivallis sp.]
MPTTTGCRSAVRSGRSRRGGRWELSRRILFVHIELKVVEQHRNTAPGVDALAGDAEIPQLHDRNALRPRSHAADPVVDVARNLRRIDPETRDFPDHLFIS